MRKALYILGDLDDHDLIWLSSVGTARQLEPGEILIQAGAPVQYLYFVLEGSMAVKTPTQDIIANLGTGDVVGEMSFVEKRAPSVSVQAQTASRVLAVELRALLAEFEVNYAFSARFHRALAVFLSDRLRSMTVGSGDVENELDEGLLDTLHVAGDRLLRLIGLLEGRQD